MVLLDSLGRRDKLKAFFASLSGHGSLCGRCTSLAEEVRAAELAEGEGLVDDALRYAVALALGAKAVVPFDGHFDGLKVPRVEPASVVGSAGGWHPLAPRLRFARGRRSAGVIRRRRQAPEWSCWGFPSRSSARSSGG